MAPIAVCQTSPISAHPITPAQFEQSSQRRTTYQLACADGNTFQLRVPRNNVATGQQSKENWQTAAGSELVDTDLVV